MSRWVEDGPENDPRNGVRAADCLADLELEQFLIALLLRAGRDGLRVTEHQMIAVRHAVSLGWRLVVTETRSVSDRMGTTEPVYELRLVKRDVAHN